MLKGIVHIIIGWSRKFGIIETTDELKKLTELRLKICEDCPFSKKSKALRIVNGKGKNVSQLYCTICHCPCEEKALVVDEKCPIGKW